MALTRKLLNALGIDKEVADQIIEAHIETTDGLKNDLQQAQDKAKDADDLRAKIADLEKKVKEAEDGDDYKAKYEEERKAHEAYKQQVEAEKAREEKSGLYRKLLEEAGIASGAIDSVLKASDLTKVTVKEGAIEGADELIKGIQEDWKGFVVEKGSNGAPVPNPPSNSGGDKSLEEMSTEEYMEYKRKMRG